MIADCETCDRKQVPCKACQVSQRAICFICHGDVADPYGEISPGAQTSKITITVSGNTGSGKSAIVGEIEIALKAIGVPVTVAERDTMVIADYQHWIDLYKPEVVIVEQNIPIAKERAFYGAQCPSYPNCNGGCGLGCTHEIEAKKQK